jgi:hypothetical protein
MSRKPVNKLRPEESRDAVWAEIRKQAGGFTIKSIAYSTMLHVDTVRDYITGLCNAGFIVKISEPGSSTFAALQYRLENDCGVDAPRVRKDGTEVTMGKGREQMWRALGILGQKGTTFTYKDLCFYSSTDESPVADADAKHYIRYLAEADYLLLVQKGTGGRPSLYRMNPAKWTGPKPPMIQRVRQLYDPNLKKVVWSEIGGAE